MCAVRVPRRVHRALAEVAKVEGVSINLFAVSVLAMAVGDRAPAAGKPATRVTTDGAHSAY